MNLTNSEQSPKLGKGVLLTLVDWVKKYHSRNAYIEIHDMGENSQRESSSPNISIRSNIIEEIAKTGNKCGGKE